MKREVLSKSLIRLVEEAIKNHEDYPTKKQLYDILKKKMSMNELIQIIIHLEAENKIVNYKNTFMYTWNPALVRRILKRKNLTIY